MYCPRCATQNSEDTKFCRACGANLSLVPQAMTGRLPDARHARRRDRHGRDDRPPDLANGIQKLFVGIGFIFVALAARFFAPAGHIWWFWMLLPAFATLGKGVAEIVSARTSSTGLPPVANNTPIPPARVTNDLPPRNTNDALPPPSVTEGTTRHLDPVSDSYKEHR